MGAPAPTFRGRLQRLSTNVRNFNAAFLSDATSTQPEAFWSRVDYEIGRLSDWNDVMAQDISKFWRDLRDFFLRSEHKSFWTELGVAPPGRKPDGDLFGASYVKLRETPTQTSKETIQSNYYDYHILWGTTWQSVQVQGYTGYKTEPSQFPTWPAP